MPQLDELLKQYGPPPPQVCLDWAWQIEGIVSGDLAASVSWNELSVDQAGRLLRTVNVNANLPVPSDTSKVAQNELEAPSVEIETPRTVDVSETNHTTATDLLKQLMEWSYAALPELGFLEAAVHSDSTDFTTTSLVSKTLEEWTRYGTPTSIAGLQAEEQPIDSSFSASSSTGESLLSSTFEQAMGNERSSRRSATSNADSFVGEALTIEPSFDHHDRQVERAEPNSKRMGRVGLLGVNKWLGLSAVGLVAAAIGLYFAVFSNNGDGKNKMTALTKAKPSTQQTISESGAAATADKSLEEQKELEELAFGSSGSVSASGASSASSGQLPSTQPQTLETIEMSGLTGDVSFDDLGTPATNELSSSLASLSAPVDFSIPDSSSDTHNATPESPATVSSTDAEGSSVSIGEGPRAAEVDATQVAAMDQITGSDKVDATGESGDSEAGVGEREVLDGVSKVTRSSVQQKGQTDIESVTGTESLKLKVFPMAQTFRFDRALADSVSRPIWQLELLPISGMTVSPSGYQTVEDRSSCSWSLESSDATSDSPKLIIRASLPNARSATLKWQIVIQSRNEPPILLPTNGEVLIKLGESLTQRITQCQIQIETMKEVNKGRGVPQATRSLIAAGRRSLEEQVKVSEAVGELIRESERMVMLLESGLAFRGELYDGDLQSEPRLRFQPEIAIGGK